MERRGPPNRDRMHSPVSIILNFKQLEAGAGRVPKMPPLVPLFWVTKFTATTLNSNTGIVRL